MFFWETHIIIQILVAINTLIIVIKCYICSYSRKGLEISIDGALIKCTSIYDEQKLLASLEFQSDKFQKQWQQIKNLF